MVVQLVRDGLLFGADRNVTTSLSRGNDVLASGPSEHPKVGHGAGIFSPCGQDVVASFFHGPSSPDTSCVAAASPKRFETS
jgi:hypothetical protein